MKALTRNQDRYCSYCFTDISPVFFEVARDVFHDHSGRMEYKVLNIENDIEDQGFKSGFYDIIIAANVLHATKNMEITLRNTRRLLKPGGKLLLYEFTNPTALNTNLVFGTLPGWWLSEEPHRAFGPLMTKETWSDYLRLTGFSGIDAVFHDFPDPADQLSSVLISTAVEPMTELIEKPPRSDSAFIIKLGNSQCRSDIAIQIHSTLSQEVPCEIIDLTQVHEVRLQNSTSIFIADLEAPVLRRMSPDILASVKHVISRSDKLLWLSRDGSTNPDYELLVGFARVIRAEHPDLQFVTMSFDDACSPSTLVGKFAEMWRALNTSTENSFRVVNGIIQIARVVAAPSISRYVQARTGNLEVTKEKFGEGQRELSLQITSLSQLNTLQFDDDPVFEMPLLEHEVEFKVMATGASFRDLASLLGQVDSDVLLGIEGSGIVTRVGPDATFNIGDKVMGLSTSGTMKTYARTCDGFLTKIPEPMDWAAAASIPFAYSAAYAVLVQHGSIGEGQSVLVHSAAGGFGQAAIQLAGRIGAEVFVTAGTPEKQNFLRTTYDISESHVFSSRDPSFKDGIRKLTQSRGVDVVLNCLSGDTVMASWDCVAPFGRFVELGIKGRFSSASLGARALGRNIRFEQFDFVYLMENDPVRAQRIFQKAMGQALAEGNIRHTPTIEYSFSKIHNAFSDIQNRSLIGRVILEPHQDDMVPMVPSRKPTTRFDPNSSFVIVGGLGGLGQTITRWAVARGARNLILLSRSGPAKTASKAFIEEITPLCQNVAAPACDVADEQALERCIAECLTYMPPIKGCLQGAMVLKVRRALMKSRQFQILTERVGQPVHRYVFGGVERRSTPQSRCLVESAQSTR